MKVHFGLPAERIPGVALTIGSFDGVHLGHQELLSRLVASGGTPCVMTFEPHPRCVVSPENCPQSITTLEEKLSLLDEAGVHDAIVLRFTRELAQVTAPDFLQALQGSLDIRCFVVGPDFAFGHRRQGTIEWLREQGEESGFGVEVVPAVTLAGHELHSSDVRRLATSGDIDEANALLGREFSVSGIVEEGEKIGRTLGYPTANLRVEPNKLLPGYGIYAGRVRTSKGDFASAMSIGYRPHFKGTKLKVEAYLIGFDGDLYHQRVEAAFVKRLRDEERFPSLEDLVEQMGRDVEEAKKVVSLSPPPAGREDVGQDGG